MESGVQLYKRSDGFVESSEGLFAVKMLKHTVDKGDTLVFTFMPYFTAEPMTLEWPKEQPFCMFPKDVVDVLLLKGHGSIPSDEEVGPYLSNGPVSVEEDVTETVEETVETSEEPSEDTTAPAPTPTPPTPPTPPVAPSEAPPAPTE